MGADTLTCYLYYWFIHRDFPLCDFDLEYAKSLYEDEESHNLLDSIPSQFIFRDIPDIGYYTTGGWTRIEQGDNGRYLYFGGTSIADTYFQGMRWVAVGPDNTNDED